MHKEIKFAFSSLYYCYYFIFIVAFERLNCFNKNLNNLIVKKNLDIIFKGPQKKTLSESAIKIKRFNQKPSLIIPSFHQKELHNFSQMSLSKSSGKT